MLTAFEAICEARSLSMSGTACTARQRCSVSRRTRAGLGVRERGRVIVCLVVSCGAMHLQQRLGDVLPYLKELVNNLFPLLEHVATKALEVRNNRH